MQCIVIEPFDGHPRGHALTGTEAQDALEKHPAKVVQVAGADPAPAPLHDIGD